MTTRKNQKGGILPHLFRRIFARTIKVEGEVFTEDLEKKIKPKVNKTTEVLNDNLNKFIAKLQIKYSDTNQNKTEGDKIVEEELNGCDVVCENENLGRGKRIVPGRESGYYGQLQEGTTIVDVNKKSSQQLTSEEEKQEIANNLKQYNIILTPEQIDKIRITSKKGGKRRRTIKKRKSKRRRTRRKP